MQESMQIEHNLQEHRFAVSLEGRTAYLAYADLGQNTLDFYRTYVPDTLRGRGIAAALVEKALAFADEQGFTVLPSCSYVEHYLAKHRG